MERGRSAKTHDSPSHQSLTLMRKRRTLATRDESFACASGFDSRPFVRPFGIRCGAALANLLEWLRHDGRHLGDERKLQCKSRSGSDRAIDADATAVSFHHIACQ